MDTLIRYDHTTRTILVDHIQEDSDIEAYEFTGPDDDAYRCVQAGCWSVKEQSSPYRLKLSEDPVFEYRDAPPPPRKVGLFATIRQLFTRS